MNNLTKKKFLRFVREPPLKSEIRVFTKVKLLLKLFQDRYKPPQQIYTRHIIRKFDSNLDNGKMSLSLSIFMIALTLSRRVLADVQNIVRALNNFP